MAARAGALEPSLAAVALPLAGPAPTPGGLLRLVATSRAALADDPQVADVRRRWLEAQLAGVAALVDPSLLWAGRVRGALGVEPALTDPGVYAAAREAVGALLPGAGDVRSRWQRWKAATAVPDVRGQAQALVARLGVPATVVLADGPARAVGSVVHVPATAAAGVLPWRVAHEVEHVRQHAAWAGTERTAHLRATPAALVAEGLALHALTAAAGPRWAAWAGLDAVHEALHEARLPLDALLTDACVLRHDRGADPDAVTAHLLRHGLGTAVDAAAVLAFVDGPGRFHAMTYEAGRNAVAGRAATALRAAGVL